MSLTKLHHGIYCLDAQYVQPGVAAIYLLVHQGKICIIETGTSLNVPIVLQAIHSLGISSDDVTYVIPTHVHLDHAGGAGALMQACSNARLIVHPRGAAHLIDPEKLITATKLVYGDTRFAQLYGEIIPVPTERVSVAEDGFKLDIGNRVLEFIDTPGHALHHYCVIDEMSSGVFSGDTFGIAYPSLTTDEGPFIFATTTPTQFDPISLLKSIDRIINRQPESIYLTHFGEIIPTPEITQQLKQSVVNQAQIAQNMKGQSKNREPRLQDAISTLLIDSIKQQGGNDSVEYYQTQFKSDARLNAQGLNAWLTRLEKAEAGRLT